MLPHSSAREEGPASCRDDSTLSSRGCRHFCPPTVLKLVFLSHRLLQNDYYLLFIALIYSFVLTMDWIITCVAFSDEPEDSMEHVTCSLSSGLQFAITYFHAGFLSRSMKCRAIVLVGVLFWRIILRKCLPGMTHPTLPLIGLLW